MKAQLFKTKVCRHFLSGRCKYGTGCTFAHSAVELQTRPDFRRTKLCSKLNCGDGSCGYAHSMEEIRDAYDVICPAWLAASCTNGQACPLSHNATHIEELAVAYRLAEASGLPDTGAPSSNINVYVSDNHTVSSGMPTPVATPTALYADVLIASLQLLGLTGASAPTLVLPSEQQ